MTNGVCQVAHRSDILLSYKQSQRQQRGSVWLVIWANGTRFASAVSAHSATKSQQAQTICYDQKRASFMENDRFTNLDPAKNRSHDKNGAHP